MANRRLDFDAEYIFSVVDDSVDYEDLQLAKAYYGDFAGKSLSVDLDKLGKYVNFNLVGLDEAFHGVPFIEKSDDIFEQSAEYALSHTDAFISSFDVYFSDDKLSFVFDDSLLVDAIGIDDNLEYGYNGDKLLYVTVKDILKDDMKKLEERLEERQVDILEVNHYDKSVENLAKKNGVNVLASALIGSRSWGYSDDHSDYDVRFVYSRDLSDYISIDDKPDTITPPIENGVDIQGYDIKKFIKLIVSQNPIIYEIINSPDQNGFYSPSFSKIWSFSEEIFDKKKIIEKYQGVILTKLKELRASSKKPLKLYIYILRMIGIVNFIEDKGMFPTCSMENVFSSESNLEYKKLVEQLIDLKKNGKTISIDDGAIKFLEKALEKTKERVPDNYSSIPLDEVKKKADKLLFDIVNQAGTRKAIDSMLDEDKFSEIREEQFKKNM